MTKRKASLNDDDRNQINLPSELWVSEIEGERRRCYVLMMIEA